MKSECAWCGIEFTQPHMGRTKKFCKSSCKQRAYESRKWGMAEIRRDWETTYTSCYICSQPLNWLEPQGIVGDHKIRERDLADRALEKSKKSVAGLLDELAVNRGMGWSDIAEVVGVSVSAVRKWRKGGVASPQSRSKLARIAALLDVLEEKGLVEDPAAWMEMDFSLEPGYFIRPLDLFLEGHVTELIELADQRQTITQVLDRVRPNWRQSRSDFEVYVDATGERAIRRRND